MVFLLILAMLPGILVIQTNKQTKKIPSPVFTLSTVSSVIFYSSLRKRAETAHVYILYCYRFFACSVIFLFLPLFTLMHEQKYDCAVQVLY